MFHTQQQHHAHAQPHSILARKPLEGACAPLGIITLEDVLELMLGVRMSVRVYMYNVYLWMFCLCRTPFIHSTKQNHPT